LKVDLIHRGWLLAVGLWTVISQSVYAKEWPWISVPIPARIDEIDSAIRKRVLQLPAEFSSGDASSAVDSLIELSDVSGIRFIELAESNTGFSSVVPLRWYLHGLLFNLPEDSRQGLVEFRSRVDARAKKMFDQARASRDSVLLRQIVNELFASSFGDNALLLLGDIALEKGQFAAARRYWFELLPLSRVAGQYGSEPFREHFPWWKSIQRMHSDSVVFAPIVYPDTDIPSSVIHARLILASILQRNFTRAESELATFRQLHGESMGHFAGRRVILVDELSELLSSEKNSPDRQERVNWTTFAGNSTRNFDFGTAIDPAVRPAWRIRLPRPDVDNPIDPQVDTTLHGCVVHPIIVDDLVLFTDGSAIYARELATGKAVSWSDNDDGVIYRQGDSRPPDDRLHSVTASGSHVFACLAGSRSTGATRTPEFDSGLLVGIDLAAQGRLLFPSISAGDDATFVGCPTVSQEWPRRNRCYVAAIRRALGTAELQIACFENGEPRWRQRIAEGEFMVDEIGDWGTNSLLTLFEDTVYACTNLGIVAALDVDDGSLRWMTRYPRSSSLPPNLLEQPWFLQRDAAPCLFADGLLLVAPQDFDGIFALDARNGQLVWRTESPPGTMDAIHLLGTAGGKLIASGRRLWWLDLATGQPSPAVFENPFPREPQSDVEGMGRGLIAGGQVYWPARSDQDQIYVFHADSGRMSRQPIPLSVVQVEAGNLIPAEHFLLVVSPGEIVAYRTSGHAAVPVEIRPSNSLPPTNE
jgi:outer membrane protein assembly factor BamB